MYDGLMPEDRDELLRHYNEMRSELLSAIRGLSDEQMADPSLDGWSVNDHLAHVALWDEVRASEVTRISAGHGSLWRMTEAQDEVYNTLGYELRKGMSAEQARWEFTNASDRLMAAIANASERGLAASRYGEAALRSTHQSEHAGWIRRWRAERGI
jgi:uncharacterized damage-inducible protein DinB